MKWIIGALAFTFGPLALSAFFIGYVAQPWGPFYIGRQPTQALPIISDGIDITDMPLAPILGPQPLVSDALRYQVARAAGFSYDEALTATAISIAENGGGNPAARCLDCVRGVHEDSRGLWQINVVAHPDMASWNLADPSVNARAALTIYRGAGWCAWSTYDARCGPGHNGAYAAYLGRARAAALP